MQTLMALVYVSSARKLPTQAQIDHLLKRANARNARVGVTGVLLYSEGSFMQYLEGPDSAVVGVFDIIKADPLHHGIIELLRQPIKAREFAEWHMAFKATSVRGSAGSLPYDPAIAERIAQTLPARSPAHALLSQFSAGAASPRSL